MTSQEKGVKFEKEASNFFVWLFEEIGFIVTKNRIQFSGTQDGFDIHIIASLNNFDRQIHIECKDYKSDLDIGNILKKAIDLEKNYHLTNNDLFIAISPRANFKNSDNSEKMSPALNEKFSFKSYLLDKSNSIEKLFAINSEYYKQIYNKEVDFIFDRSAEIERFKSIIFSRKPFKKIFLAESDKNVFINNVSPTPNYIPRFLTSNFNHETFNFFTSINGRSSQSLDDVLAIENKILLLGNPGLGKSTELKEFALSKWKIGEQDGLIPIFRNLKNFTIQNEIYDFLPENFEDITQCYIIFDGIDEIKDSQDFISKLEVFIERCTISKNKSIKFLLSCRTNIYESIVKNINDFKIFYLTNLSTDEAFALIEKQLIDPKLIHKLAFSNNHYDFLKNPFLIKILSNYINNNNSLPSNSSQLWENYIEKRLEFDNKDKLLKLNLKTSLIKKTSKKISLISELMKVNSIHENEIFDLISENTSEYLKSPLIEKDLKNNSWSFEHRNIQEFFAAKYLSEFSHQRIINFICISENKERKGLFDLIKEFFDSNKEISKRTHPSLFNTITFLINILEDKKRQKIIEWLEINNPEILFTADSDRIDLGVRSKVFQNYFKKTCIENTFWISHNRSFSVETIAKFGDCEVNFNYLVSIVENVNNHFRVIISALDLLAHMTLLTSNKDRFQTILLSKLKSKNIDSSNSIVNDLKIKSHIINCIQKLNLHAENSSYLFEILVFFKDEDDKDFNYSLLNLLNNLEGEIDQYFEFIFKEFLMIFKIKQRTKVSTSSSGKILIEDLILRIKKSENFLKILNYVVAKNNYYIEFDQDFISQIFKKCESFIINDKNFIYKIIPLIEDNQYLYYREEELIKMFNKTTLTDEVIRRILENRKQLDDNSYFIARLLSYNNIDLVLEKFIKEKTNTKEVEVFRNVVGNTNDRELALFFEEKMKDAGYIFSEKYLSTDEREKLDNERNFKAQQNFDKLFDIKILETEIQNIFNEIDKDCIDWNIVCEYRNKCDKRHSYSLETDSSLVVLCDLIKDNGSLTFPKVLHLLNNINVVMNEVRRFLAKRNLLKVSPKQKDLIYEWCLNAIKDINYDKIIQTKEDTYSLFQDYYITKNIYEFQKIFDFELPQEFYIGTLKYCDFQKRVNEEKQFDFILNKIKDKQAIANAIIKNINSEGLNPVALESHISFAIKNNLIESFEKIKEFFSKDIYILYQNKNLEKIFTKTNDLAFIKKCCNNISSNLCWEAVKILVKNGLEKEYTIDISKNYLTLNEIKYKTEALGVLFYYNTPEAMEMFFDFLKYDEEGSIKVEYYSVYDNEEGIKFIEDFYYLLYDDYGDSNVFKYHYAKELYRHYLNNMSAKNDDSFNTVQRILKKIKKELKNNKKEMFYINLFIENSINSFVTLKSKPLDFKEAKLKVDFF